MAQHSHKPSFGRHVEGCLRCQELKAGAEPVRWDADRRTEERGRARRWQGQHFAPGGPHDRGDCGPVCTYGDW